MSDVISLIFISQVLASQPAPLSLEQCRQLVTEHKANNSVEYKAGVDVDNQPVVPADLPGNKTFDLGDQVAIDLQLPLRKYPPNFLATAPNDYTKDILRKSEMHVGQIVVNKDGSVFINGQEAGDEQTNKLAATCRQRFPDL